MAPEPDGWDGWDEWAIDTTRDTAQQRDDDDRDEARAALRDDPYWPWC
jgi:hypothetical protein